MQGDTHLPRRACGLSGHAHRELELSPGALQDRFPIASRNLGFPLSITLIATYPPTSAPSYDRLAARITELQRHLDLLWVRVCDSQTTTPYFEQRSRAWLPEEVLSDNVPYDTSGSSAIEGILRAEFEQVLATDVDVSPSWSVRRYIGTADQRVHAALTIQHDITDGAGALALFNLLLSDNEVPDEKLDGIPKMEDTIPGRPSFRFFWSIMMEEVLGPHMPLWLRSWILPHLPWPGTAVKKRPMDCPGEVQLVFIPPETVQGLRQTGAKFGVKLHAILKTSYLIAQWIVLTPPSSPTDATLHRGHTPLTERKAHPSHPAITGNFTSATESDLVLSPKRKFWETVTVVHEQFTSPAGRREAQLAMNVMGYLPNKDLRAQGNPTRPTGWEETFHQKMVSDRPYRSSLTMSNLGRISLPPGATDVCWSQNPHPFQPVVSACVIGHEAGIRVSCVWRDGAVVTREDVGRINQVYMGILELVAADEVDKDATLQTLLERSAT